MLKALRQRTASRWISIVTWSLGAIASLLIMLVIMLSAVGVPVPEFLKEKVATRISELTSGAVRLERLIVALEKDWRLALVVEGLEIKLPASTPILMDNMHIRIDSKALLRGVIRPITLTGFGLRLQAHRDMSGKIYVSGLSPDMALERDALSRIIQILEEHMVAGLLASIKKAVFDGVVLDYQDKRNGKKWHITDGSFSLENADGILNASLALSIQHENTRDAVLRLHVRRDSKTKTTDVLNSFNNVATRDLGQQFESLSWLNLVDAYADGTIGFSLIDGGVIKSFSGQLDLSPGKLIVADYAEAEIKDVHLDFDFYLDEQRLDVKDLRLSNEIANLKGSASFFLQEFFETPATLSVQIFIEELKTLPNSLISSPFQSNGGLISMRVSFDPLKIEVSRSNLPVDGASLFFSGQFEKRAEGWVIDFDANTDRLNIDTVKKYWPNGIKANALRWIKKNIGAAQFSNINAAYRLTPGQKPVTVLQYDISDMELRYLRRFPPLEAVEGHLVIQNNKLHFQIDKGYVKLSDGERVFVTNTNVLIDELDIASNPLEIDTNINGSVPAVLRFLNVAPIELVAKQGVSLDIAQGDVHTRSRIKFRIKEKLSFDDASFEVNGSVFDFKTQKLVAGRRISAPTLQIKADNDAISIGGAGVFDGIGFDIAWHQSLNKKRSRTSTIKGEFELSGKALSVFGFKAAEGLFSGQTKAQTEIVLERGKAPKVSLSSDLRGLGGDLPQFGWSFSKQQEGLFRVEATLGEAPVIERFEIEAGSFLSEGTARFSAEWGLQEARIKRLRTGNGIDISARVSQAGNQGALRFEITGGRVDAKAFGNRGGLKRINLKELLVKLDSVKISPDLTLREFAGYFNPSDNFKGKFSALLGQGRIDVEVIPKQSGLNYLVKSKDAGLLFIELGILRGMEGGEMELYLEPDAAKGSLDGYMKIGTFKITDAPLMADLLSVLSIVGLLEKLAEDGILFSNLKAAFSISRERFELKSGYAIGTSLGISAEGVIEFEAKMMDLSFVVSPFYFFNALGQVFTRNREGLFGFGARMKGALEAPEITVNPLLILVPGNLRDLIRKKADEPSDENK